MEEEEQIAVQGDDQVIIYGSPEAELYFRQSILPPGGAQSVAIEVDDLSAKSRLVVRPLSSPDCHIPPSQNQLELNIVKSETSSTVANDDEDYDDEEVPYTEEEDLENKSHAARVASRLGDFHRPVPGEHPLEHHAEQMAEAIVASAVFETVFLLQSDDRGIRQEEEDNPLPEEKEETSNQNSNFIGTSLCRVRILSPALSSFSFNEGIPYAPF